MEDTIVFIDGHYLSLISKYFGNGISLKFDINQFAITLAKENNLWCKGVFYYTAPPYQHSIPTFDEMQRRASYDKFVNKMKRIDGFSVREARCQKTDSGYRQKGVDSLFLIDLFQLPQNIKTIILVACDTDFVPILNEMRKEGVKVKLYYFSDFIRNSMFSMSNHIFSACDECFLIEKGHFERSVLKHKSEIVEKN